MASKSGISWTHATWDPVTGCEKISPGCKFCYAEREWADMQHIPMFTGRKFTDVACHDERLDQPIRWKRQRLIFVNSRADLFHDDVPFSFVDQVFAVMGLSFVARDNPHVFQVLTKRPDRMKQYLDDPNTIARVTLAMKRLGGKYYGGLPGENCPPHWPLPNVWIGVSVENQATADQRVPVLLDTKNIAVRWVSCEPLLENVQLGVALNNIDWVVVGGESGDKARVMPPSAAMQIKLDCKMFNVPFFFKQWGEWIPIGQVHDTVLAAMPGVPLAVIDGITMCRAGTRISGDYFYGAQYHELPTAAHDMFDGDIKIG